MKKLLLILSFLIISFSCEVNDISYCIETNSCNLSIIPVVNDNVNSVKCYLNIYDSLSTLLFTDTIYTTKTDFFSYYAVPAGILILEVIVNTTNPINPTLKSDTTIFLNVCEDQIIFTD